MKGIDKLFPGRIFVSPDKIKPQILKIMNVLHILKSSPPKLKAVIAK